MIGFLKGRLAVKQPPMLMVDVNGVGYEMEAPMSTFYGLPATGEPVALFTHLVVREDAHILYAFGTDGERRLFRGLLKVSGVGPKIALGILSGARASTIFCAPSRRRTSPCSRGFRASAARPRNASSSKCATACKKLSVPGGRGGSPVDMGAAATPQSEAFSALIALGYKPPEVVRLLKAVDTADLVDHRNHPARAQVGGQSVMEQYGH